MKQFASFFSASSLIKSSLTKLALITSLLLFSSLTFAQNYVGINYRIDSLVNIGLPKSALAEVDKLDKLARKNKDAPQQIKAAICRMTFQSYLEENALVAIIDTLKQDINNADYPVKPVLQSLLGGMYWSYYQQNRWQINQRSRLEKPGSDLTKWDLTTINSEMLRLFKLSLQDHQKEQNTPISVLDGVLKGDESTRYLRPTLYDLLVQRAFDFLLNDEPALTKPKLPFTLNDPRFFSDSRSFAGLTVATTDTASTFYQGIKYLQQATLFHLQKHDEEALADLDIKRVYFLYNKATMPDKDSLYIKALKQIISGFSTKPISADAMVTLGEYYQQKNNLITAMACFKQAVAAFPQSIGGKNAAVLIRQIEQKALWAVVENVNMPGKPLLAQINYTNVKTARYSIYHLTEAEYKRYITDEPRYNLNYNSLPKNKWLSNYIGHKKPVQQNELQLPDLHDYHMHHTEFKINALTQGNYLICVENASKADSLLINYTDFKVSNLAYISRGNPDNTVELKVMNRETGEPIKGARVSLTYSYQVYSNSRSTQKDTTVSGLTDKIGGFKPDGLNYNNFNIEISYKGDTLSNNTKYIIGVIDNEDDEPDDKTVLFTDRQIYRPGQTIYFKGLKLSVLKGKNSIEPLKDVKIDFKDVNNKIVSTLNLKTNDFGTFSGIFTVPMNILDGEVRLETADGNINVRVEEYKRPTFQTQLFPVTESYKLNDSVKIRGKVTAFSGYGLSQAKVAYHITRAQSRLNYDYVQASYYVIHNPATTEIKTDTIVTNNQGEFEIKFKAIPGESANYNRSVYNYAINVDVTDASGETNSENTSVNVSNNNIQINTYIPDQVFAKDTGKIAIAINSLNGQLQKGSLKVQIYSLQNPDHLFKSRLWTLPDQWMINQNDFKNWFPGYAYRNEDDVKTWARLSELSNVQINVDSSKRSFINLHSLSSQASGIYRVVISAQNEKGDTTSVTKYVHLIADPAKPSKFADWVIPVFNSVKAGGQAEFLVGTGVPVHVLLEKYKGSKLITSEWLYIAQGQQRIKIPVNVNDSNINVQFMMVYHNRAYSSYQPITITRPDKQLDIRMLSFRNLLQPGEKEQWKLQITAAGNEKQAAEMVAGLYDASLDDIAPAQNWRNALNPRQQYNRDYFIWNSYSFVSQDATKPLFYKNYSYPLIQYRYEALDMFGYNYYGEYNAGYHQYLESVKARMTALEKDKLLQDEYLKNAALVKDGFDISGRVTDKDGLALPGVTITIKGTTISTSTNISGNFKIRVPTNNILTFRFIGYNYQEAVITKNNKVLNIALSQNEDALNEVTVVGYGTEMKRDLTGVVGSVSTIAIRGVSTLDQALQEKVAGMHLVDPNSDYVIMRELHTKPGDKFSKEVIVRGTGDISSLGEFNEQSKPIAMRTNFNETAFFYPQLRTNEKGEILLEFTMPEALTKWRFKAFAHTKDLKTGYLETEVVTQKQLSISANMPRFLREGDTVTVSARLANLTADVLKGKVNIQLFNALTMQPVQLLLTPADAEQTFDLASATNKAVSFRMVIPAGLDALTYRLTADAGQFTDGEENTIPVLPNRMLVTESMPMMVRAGQERSFSFDKLVNNKSTTLKSKTLTLEYTQNPAWYAVQAFPYMMEFPYECSEQVFSRYYANSLATNLINKMPVIKQVFDQWKAGNSTELLSNLEKNQELKSTLLEETPWLQDAINESEQKKRIALLFDLNKMSYELQLNLNKLKDRQLPNGSFPWFGGNWADPYITRHVLAGIGQLYHLGIVDTKNEILKGIADKAMAYTDRVLVDEADREKRNHTYNNRDLDPTEIHTYYTQSYFTSRTLPGQIQPLLANYLDLAAKQWKYRDIYEQAMIALTMQRNNKPEVARMIIRSLMETAQHTDDMGMYWAKNQLGYYWYQSPIETQSLMIELFTEAGGNDKAVEEMKIWLLREKQTTNWKTTKATAAACYALLLKGDNWLAETGTSEIKLGGKPVTELKPDLKSDAGTGYIKANWVDEQVKPALGKVEIRNNGKTISWGALHWQYLENLDKITPSQTDIHLERKYFIQKQTDAGPILTAVDAKHQPQTGDLLKVIVYLKAGRDFEYVQLKDMRPAGTEPVDALSGYKFQDGLYYYQVTKDVATNFFISSLNKGSYVFEYRLRVAQPGNFSTGISTVQCMYAPEFNAHSESGRMVIK